MTRRDIMAKQTILIVEDDRKVIELIAVAIEKIGPGYNIEVAYNGAEALEIITRNNIDMVLLDIHMPVMSGAQLLVELCRRKIWFPILIMTAYNVDDIQGNLFEYGIIDLLVKPLDIRVLQTKIQDILKKREQKDSIFGMSLATIMQVLEIEKRTGIMTIKIGERICRLFFKTGKVMDIEAEGVSGEEALVNFLDDSIENKEVNIEYLTHQRRERISQSFTQLILNVSRLKDEAGRDIGISPGNASG